MKTLLIGIAFLASASSIAEVTYKCTSNKGLITVTEKSNDEVSINFGRHSVKKLDYFTSSYTDLIPHDQVTHDETLPQYEGWNAIVNISNVNLKSGVNKLGFLSQRRFLNNSKKLIANSDGSQDFSSFDVEFSLNKSKLSAKVEYSVSAWFKTYGKMSDKLKCEKL